MNPDATAGVRLAAPVPWTSVVAQAWRTIGWNDWRMAGCYAAAVFLLLAPVNLVYGGSADGWSVATGAIASVTQAVLLLGCISVANEIARSSNHRWRPYVAAATASAVLATGAEAAAIWSVGGQAYMAWKPAISLPSTLAYYVSSGLIATFAYAYYRWATAGTASLHAVQLERARIQREILDVRLHALQARIEPRILFDTLKVIEDLCITDRARADEVLAALIDYLRAALPDLSGGSSRVGREIELARSYVTVVCGRQPAAIPFDVAASVETLAHAITPMVLPSLVAAIVPMRPSAGLGVTAVGIAARVESERLHITVRADFRCAPASLATDVSYVRDLLRDTYAGDARLVQETSQPTRIAFALELRHDRAASTDR